MNLGKPSFSQTFLNSSIIEIQIQKHNLKINQTITIKAKKKKKKKRHKPSTIWAALGRKTSGDGEAEGAEAQRAERRCGRAEPSNPSILSLSTSFSISYKRESWIMFWDQVEKEKKK